MGFKSSIFGRQVASLVRYVVFQREEYGYIYKIYIVNATASICVRCVSSRCTSLGFGELWISQRIGIVGHGIDLPAY